MSSPTWSDEEVAVLAEKLRRIVVDSLPIKYEDLEARFVDCLEQKRIDAAGHKAGDMGQKTSGGGGAQSASTPSDDQPTWTPLTTATPARGPEEAGTNLRTSDAKQTPQSFQKVTNEVKPRIPDREDCGGVAFERRAGRCSGAWTLAGTRLTVATLVSLYTSGMSSERIQELYPILTWRQVEAAVALPKQLGDRWLDPVEWRPSEGLVRDTGDDQPKCTCAVDDQDELCPKHGRHCDGCGESLVLSPYRREGRAYCTWHCFERWSNGDSARQEARDAGYADGFETGLAVPCAECQRRRERAPLLCPRCFGTGEIVTSEGTAWCTCGTTTKGTNDDNAKPRHGSDGAGDSRGGGASRGRDAGLGGALAGAEDGIRLTGGRTDPAVHGPQRGASEVAAGPNASPATTKAWADLTTGDRVFLQGLVRGTINAVRGFTGDEFLIVFDSNRPDEWVARWRVTPEGRGADEMVGLSSCPTCKRPT